jgi:dipeptidase E
MSLRGEEAGGRRRAVFLGGGGSEIAERPVWSRFLQSLAGHRVLYVPQALGADPQVLGDAEGWFREALRRQHPDRRVEISVSRDLSEVDVSAFDGVFFGGGNTPVLRAAIARARMDDAIRAFSRAGKAVYGGSAGAIVLGRLIDVSDEHVTNGPSDSTRGLDLLGGLTCFCHYQAADAQKVLAYVAARQATVLALPEDGGAVFDGEGIEALGAAPIAIFRSSDSVRLTAGTGERIDRESWSSSEGNITETEEEDTHG